MSASSKPSTDTDPRQSRPSRTMLKRAHLSRCASSPPFSLHLHQAQRQLGVGLLPLCARCCRRFSGRGERRRCTVCVWQKADSRGWTLQVRTHAQKYYQRLARLSTGGCAPAPPRALQHTNMMRRPGASAGPAPLCFGGCLARWHPRVRAAAGGKHLRRLCILCLV